MRHASNRAAYDRLHIFYQELAYSVGTTPEDIKIEMEKRITNDDLKKMRQVGMTVEELLNGFPTWEKLVDKNIYDDFYQDISKLADFVSDDLHDISDIF